MITGLFRDLEGTYTGSTNFARGVFSRSAEVVLARCQSGQSDTPTGGAGSQFVVLGRIVSHCRGIPALSRPIIEAGLHTGAAIRIAIQMARYRDNSTGAAGAAAGRSQTLVNVVGRCFRDGYNNSGNERWQGPAEFTRITVRRNRCGRNELVADGYLCRERD